MQLKNGHATLVAINPGGANKPSLSLTLKFETELADTGPVGTVFFEDWPLLRHAVAKVLPEQPEALSTAAAGIFGKGAHKLRLWGMDAERRNEHSSPLVVCNAVSFAGAARAEVSVSEGEMAQVTVKLTLKGSIDDFHPVLLQDVVKNLHCEVWADLEPVQSDVEDDVAPTKRKPGKDDGRQSGLALADGEA